MKNSNISYVLFTAARNEEEHIEETIKSVISQTILPKKWVIVSDGSTDSTDVIVKQYEENFNFIKLLPREAPCIRSFVSKVYAIREAINFLHGIEYDFIGNLDADVSFESTYYENVLKRFKNNLKLGIAGGVLFERVRDRWIRQFVSEMWSVSGPIQLFRRQCYENIGGYLPLKKGGVDAIAEVMARMNGWEVRSFPEIKVFHHRRTGTEKGNILYARFHQGQMEYSHGYHPLFEVMRCFARTREKPYILGSIFRFIGFCFSYVQKEKRGLSHEIIKYLRREQMQRLLTIFRFYRKQA